MYAMEGENHGEVLQQSTDESNEQAHKGELLVTQHRDSPWAKSGHRKFLQAQLWLGEQRNQAITRRRNESRNRTHGWPYQIGGGIPSFWQGGGGGVNPGWTFFDF